MSVFLAVSFLIIGHIALFPDSSPPRRLFASALDSGTITYFFFNAGEYALPLYFLYLWIIFGYGFRFGKRYLFFTLLLSLAGFGAAILQVPYWESHFFLGVGLWTGMLLVSLYVSKLVGRLTKALDSAEAANLAKRKFISSVSHELRTPLNALIGMADLLRGTALSHEQRDMVLSMENASQMMLSLVEDVLDFSKIEAGKLMIENTEFDLHQLVHGTMDIFQYEASGRGLSLVTSIDPRVTWALRGDPHHLRQVLVNLLSNALKFTKEGKVVLRIKSLYDTEQAVKLRFEVEDTGIGIAAEAQLRIFDSFTQADESTTRRYGGTGLGTTISKQLVESMKGRIGVRSTLGAGSLFWIELPLQKQLAAVDRRLSASLPVLLIGFDPGQRAQLVNALASAAIHSDVVDTPGLAIQRLNANAGSESHYRLLILSGMAVKSSDRGLQALVRDLRRAARADLPVILCGTEALQARNSWEIAEEADVAAILEFPVESPLLFNALHGARLPSRTAAEAEAPGVELSAGLAGVTQYSILVAEDNPINSKLMEKILERAGHLCTLAENGEEALDRLGQQEFDAIVFDMNMPYMSGLEATKAYCFMFAAEMRAPVIMFSADVTTEVRDECLNAGADEFLPKPIQVSLFLETLDRLVRKSNGTSCEPAYRAPVAQRHAEPAVEDLVLNYATLTELECIGQDPLFVDGLLARFIEDNWRLIDKLEGALLLFRFEEVKEIIHAMKGSALTIGASSLKMTCQRLERMSQSELRQDVPEIMNLINGVFSQLCEALEQYRKQRNPPIRQRV
ncbi:MAG: ATP-binding protein [Pseudomonadota bacterium]